MRRETLGSKHHLPHLGFVLAVFAVLFGGCSDSDGASTVAEERTPPALRTRGIAHGFRLVDGFAHAVNPGQGFVADLAPDAALRLVSGLEPGWEVSLKLGAMGRPGAMLPAPVVVSGPRVSDDSALFVRAGIEEWYRNGLLGIEQGFVLAQAPAAAGSCEGLPGIARDPVVLEIEVDGMSPATTERAGILSLRRMDGGGLFYGGLAAWDADGRDLHSWLDVRESSILITVDDRGARYPITIDPLVWVDDQKLTQEGTGTANDQLGLSVAVSGDTALVGAYGNDELGLDAGAVYVFELEGTAWVEKQKLTASDPDAGDYFGYAVSLDGDTAVIGSYGDDEAGEDAGAAYVFVRSGGSWSEQGKVMVAGAQAFDFFGAAVALHGDAFVAGAYGDDEKGSMGGAAYVFGRDTGGANTWGQQAKLVAAEGEAQDQFGAAVAFDGTSVLVGANGDDAAGSLSGAAYVFVESGGVWLEQGKLVAQDGSPLDRFGAAVSIDGDTAAVGAYLANTSVADAGAVYIFERSGTTWTEQQKLTPSDAEVQDYFGCSVAVRGDRLLVGGWGDSQTANSAGAAYAFERVGASWSELGKIQSSDIAANDWFGIAVALDETTALIGATGEDDTGSAAGAAYVMEQDGTDPALWSEQGKLIVGEGLGAEYLGYSVAVDGNTAIAGAYGADDAGGKTGAAYVFSRDASGWSQEARLVAADGAADDRFGYVVSVTADTALVGAYLHDGADTDSGAAYVFVRSGTAWTLRSKLEAADAALNDNFGVAVVVDGDRAVIGAHLEDEAGTNAGAAYVFQRAGTTWSQAAKLTASDGGGSDAFGRSVALSGDTIVVGAPNDDDGGTNAGAAYVFEWSGGAWNEAEKLLAADPTASASFGFSVSVHADTVLVGAYLDDAGATDCGSAYVFSRSSGTWSQQAKLVASDPAENDRFGVSVSVRGNEALAGAYFADAKGSNSGAAYAFERSGTVWTEQQKLTADDGLANDYFGYSVALAGTTAVCGAYGDDDRGSASGALYALALRRTIGEVCVNADQCESGNCVDGVCCALAVCPDCHSCAVTGYVGQCTALGSLEGEPCGDSMDSECSQPDTCDAEGTCQPNHLAEGTSCGSAEDTECTDADSCDGAGTCLPNHAPEDAPCGDGAETECTYSDTCNGEGACAANDLPDGTECADGQCEGGECVGGSGGSGGAAGGGGASGSGGAGGGVGGGESGSGGTGGGSGAPAGGGESDSDSGGCGCRMAGAPVTGGIWVAVLAGAAMVLRRRRRLVLPVAAIVPFVAVSGCGDSSDGGVSGGGAGGGADAGVDGEPGTGGTGGTGASGGTGGTGTLCPPEQQCGVACCTADQECEDGQCVPVCPPPRERCGDPPVCCEEGEQCHNNACVAACEPPEIPCGTDDLVCCDASEVCFNSACVVPSGDCIDFADCDEDEYCEPTIGKCLPASALPECEYRPPVGEFQPIREWAYSPVTAPYVRSTTTQTGADICAEGFPLAFSDADEALIVVPLGALAIPFFDQERHAMTVSTNGWLTLDDKYAGGPVPDNGALLAQTTPELIVAPYWDDLKHVTGCALVDATLGRVVVQWRGEVGTTGEWVRFQAILHASSHTQPGVIELRYLQLGATQDGDGATTGIAERSTGRAIQHGLNRNGAVSTSASLRYDYVPLRNRFDALTGPAVFDVDGDGRPEVIFPAYDDTPTSNGAPNDVINGLHSGVLTILNGEDGTIQARPLETDGYDGYLGGGVALSVGDLDGDGTVEIVGVGRVDPMVEANAYIKAFRADGTLLWVSDQDVGFNHNGWGGGVHIADLDGDGHPEIFFGLSVFSHEGALLWSEPHEYGSPATTAADLDGDGDLEIVSDRSAWHHDHTLLWQRSDLTAYHFPSIADFDLDGTPEVALVSSGAVTVLNGVDGSTFLEPVSLDTAGGGPLNIGDFDADGYPEIGTAGEGSYLVLDLQCVGDPLPSGCDREGIRWSSPTKDISSNVTGSSLFDFEGDGVAEVVYSDECFTRVYSGVGGQVLFETSVNTRTATEYPLVVDADGDNNAEIIVTANENVVGCNAAPWSIGLTGVSWERAEYPPPFCTNELCGHRGLAVYGDALDNWVRTRRVWSGHAYHITNVLSSGAIPQQEEPNWTNPRYNNFRMNAQGSALFSAPDLQVSLEADPLACPIRLRLRAMVSNGGAIGVSDGVDVAFFKRAGSTWECLGVVQTAADLLPGAETEVTLDYVLSNELGTELEFRAVVDSDCGGNGQHNECEVGGEDNNEATASGVCTSTGPS